jgi:manganese efflux pump family protein
MAFFNVFLTGVGLSMDAVAVSICSGLSTPNVKWSQAFKMAFFFGAFQAAMPVAGYFGGIAFQQSLRAIDHWIAFGLLGFIGGKMMYEGLRRDDDDDEKPGVNFETRRLIMLAIATSVDALAVGLTFSLLEIAIVLGALVIGLVTFSLCLPAVRLGARLGAGVAHRAEFFGGIILLGIGLKILLEHLINGV